MESNSTTVKLFFLITILAIVSCSANVDKENRVRRPNILFAIADDQSYPYASAYGIKGINTPAFDRVAHSGILFNNAFVAAPQCSPSRAAILTGNNIWQLEEAGTHASSFPKKFTVFTDLLEENGYAIGYTGKPWGPGNWEISGRKRNPVGPEYNTKRLEEVPATGISKLDYYGNFVDFMEHKDDNKPFFFWYGGHEPHRVYEAGSGAKSGKTASKLDLPSFLPDDSVTRNDMMDYALEIEYFDSQLGKMLDLLHEMGELENTIVVVTADNGMPFPYAKANLQDYGTHVPLAIAWPNGIKTIRVAEDLVSMIDLAPTFLELADVKNIPEMSGRSIVPIFEGAKQNFDSLEEFVLTGRERHTHARPDNLGYPARAIRTRDFLMIKNYKPDRWPVGDPVPDTEENRNRAAVQGFTELFPGYHDIDGSPTKTFMMEHQNEFPLLFANGFLKREEVQLYYIKEDPGCLYDLAQDPNYLEIKDQLLRLLDEKLVEQGDPRMSGSEIFDSYPRYSPMRNFAGFTRSGEYRTF